MFMHLPAYCDADAEPGVVIRSPATLKLYETISRIAPTMLPVLIRGETGSGKELVARAVHAKSRRANAPFRALNCAAIPPNLVESILFGHERGAFTGAERQTQGVFEQARGGAVFLDEIGELAPHAQAALLRALEERRVIRVGGSREIPIDVRIVAATHRDLATMAVAGAFREDLLFRIDGVSLHVAPLRQRTEEILPLAEFFLCRASGTDHAEARRISEEAAHALLTYAWPGNVRQLKNVIERAAALAPAGTVYLEHLPEPLHQPERPSAPTAMSATRSSGRAKRTLPERVRAFEMELLTEALRDAQGNQARAARLLGIPRKTLTYKLCAHGLMAGSHPGGELGRGPAPADVVE
jgi:two-component system, NtrC family, response regulator AtoC